MKLAFYSISFLVLYLVVNIGFFFVLDLNLSNGTCATCFSHSIFGDLPVTSTAYQRLTAIGDYNKAILVREFYSFNLLIFVVGTLLAIITCKYRLNENAVQNFLKQRETEALSFGRQVFVSFIVIFMILFVIVGGFLNDTFADNENYTLLESILFNTVVYDDTDIFRHMVSFAALILVTSAFIRTTCIRILMQRGDF